MAAIDWHPIRHYLKKCNYSREDLSRALKCHVKTVHAYVDDPLLIRLKDLIVIAGLFGIPVEELVYLISRYRPQSNKDSKWYIQEIENKYKPV